MARNATQMTVSLSHFDDKGTRRNIVVTGAFNHRTKPNPSTFTVESVVWADTKTPSDAVYARQDLILAATNQYKVEKARQRAERA